ncbi:13349_t:CDS:2 [Dentiscutata heterogama]|uniref:13349_t:CDS:1 n=1 Tax=Dentiscutata heterogama TaxID=1316150 RepID=A0ACA9KHS3_9GLOM|nr:13349_t:CDS:2 [Dentiscutata heterogama]
MLEVNKLGLNFTLLKIDNFKYLKLPTSCKRQLQAYIVIKVKLVLEVNSYIKLTNWDFLGLFELAIDF